MRRRPLANRHWLFLAAALLGLLALGGATGLRSRIVGWVSPSPHKSRTVAWAEERNQLLYENRRLRQELERVGQLWRHERETAGRLSGLQDQWKSGLSTLQTQAKAAHLIYRDAMPWGSTFWIDLGAGQVERQSPVVLGNTLVGVVDYVGKGCSRVRCVTDSELIVAVRVARGNPQVGALLHHVDCLLMALSSQEDWAKPLTQLRERLSQPRELAYLAKGEVAGAGTVLKGSGFNYDFADNLGLGRDLRTPDLLLAGDLIITSGLDGVFPPGLDVGWVTQVEPLHEGSIAYEVEVRPIAPQLSHLETVLVLPPLKYESGVDA